MLIAFVFVDYISQLIQYSANYEYVLIIAVIIAVDAITALPFAFLRFQNKAIKFSSIRIISVVITISLNLIFLVVIPNYYGENYNELPVYRSTNLVTFVFIANLIGSLSTLLMLSKEFKIFVLKLIRYYLKNCSNTDYQYLSYLFRL